MKYSVIVWNEKNENVKHYRPATLDLVRLLATLSTFGNFSESTTVYSASLQQIYTPFGGITYLGWGWPDQTEIVFQTNMTGQPTYFTPILIE